MSAPVNIFFMGKGGVGKSTSAALSAVFLSKKGFRVLIVSLDPAHNLSDIFEKKLGDRPVDITTGLKAIEIDQEKWIKTYLKDIRQQISRTYSYLTAFNLDKYFDIVKHSPGLEEYALILAYTQIINRFGRHDFVLLDMPPTALSLKFFALPTLSLLWLEQLLSLRAEIIQKKEIITKIKFIKKEREQDKILNQCNRLNDEYCQLRDLFSDPEKTLVNLVSNPDQLALAESVRIVNALANIDVRVNRIIYNKIEASSQVPPDHPSLSTIPVLRIPPSDAPLIGLDILENFLNSGDPSVGQQLEQTFQGVGS